VDPKIQLNPEPPAAQPSPSQAIVADRSKVVRVTDAKGRVLGIRRPTVLQRMRLFEIVGKDNVGNEAYFGYASLAYHVVEIDGEAQQLPVSKRELEARVAVLDDDGLNAVAKGALEHFSDGLDEDTKTQIKNALGTQS
jgi:hypothetical protein